MLSAQMPGRRRNFEEMLTHFQHDKFNGGESRKKNALSGKMTA